MAAGGERDAFDKARAVAVVILLISGGLAIAGSLLDWVAIGERPELVQEFDFGDQRVPAPKETEPLSGLDVRDGRWTLAGGIVLVVAAVLVVIRKTAAWGWVAFGACLIVGAVGFADYRAVGSTAFARRIDELGLEVIGERRPGVGLTMVAVAAVVGIIGAATAIAASPRRDVGYNDPTL